MADRIHDLFGRTPNRARRKASRSKGFRNADCFLIVGVATALSGPIALFRYIEVCPSTGQREAGFLAAIKKFPEIQVIVDNRSSGTTISEAHSTASNMLGKIKEADGIFCSNEPSTLGMLRVLKQNNLAGSKKLVGFDTSPGLVEGLKRGEIQALVAQNPKKMGREAVQALVAKMKGETVLAVIDSRRSRCH